MTRVYRPQTLYSYANYRAARDPARDPAYRRIVSCNRVYTCTLTLEQVHGRSLTQCNWFKLPSGDHAVGLDTRNFEHGGISHTRRTLKLQLRSDNDCDIVNCRDVSVNKCCQFFKCYLLSFPTSIGFPLLYRCVEERPSVSLHAVTSNAVAFYYDWYFGAFLLRNRKIFNHRPQAPCIQRVGLQNACRFSDASITVMNGLREAQNPGDDYTSS